MRLFDFRAQLHSSRRGLGSFKFAMWIVLVPGMLSFLFRRDMGNEKDMSQCKGSSYWSMLD